MTWNLLAGYADIITVGQQGFVGVGAYAFFGLTALGHMHPYLAIPLAALTFVSIWLLLRSRVGLGLTAMRDNEEAAGSAGVNLTATRILCFLFTAPILGLVGVLATLEKLRVAPSASFSITDWTIYVIFIVVIGGIGSLEGPFIGAAVFYLLREFLSDYGTWYLILLGAISIFVILVEPRGLWGLLRRIVRADVIPIGHTPFSVAQAESRG